MAIALFAIIGASIDAGVAYWICFAIYCIVRVVKAVYDTIKEM